MVFSSPLSFSFNSLFSTPEKEDFQISDFYTQVADRRPVRVLDDELVIVDVGEMDRLDLADAISTVALCGPKGVGIDVMFGEPGLMGKEVDSLLLLSIRELVSVCPVVFPLDVKKAENDIYEIKEKPFFYGEIDGVTYGAANLPSKFRGGVIREFKTSYPPFSSFPVEIARRVDPSDVEYLEKRDRDLEMIDYNSHEYTIIAANRLLERSEELSGKTVIMGSMTDSGDIHAIPLRAMEAGVIIQASAVHTVLSGKYYEGSGKYWDWISACVLCFLLTWVGLLVNAKVKGLVVRILQLVIVYFAVWIGYSLYVDHRLIINFTYTLMMAMFGLFAADVWNGIIGISEIIRDKRKKKKRESLNSNDSI